MVIHVQPHDLTIIPDLHPFRPGILDVGQGQAERVDRSVIDPERPDHVPAEGRLHIPCLRHIQLSGINAGVGTASFELLRKAIIVLRQ